MLAIGLAATAGCGGPAEADAKEGNVMIANLRSTGIKTRAMAAKRLGELKYADAVYPLTKVLNDHDASVRMNAIWALGQIGGERTVKPLIGVLGSKEAADRKLAAEALGKVKDARGVTPLIAVLNDGNAAVAGAAANALIAIGRPAVDPLCAALKDGLADCSAARAVRVEIEERERAEAARVVEKAAKEKPEQKKLPEKKPAEKKEDKKPEPKPLPQEPVLSKEQLREKAAQDFIERAVYALGEIGDPAAIPALRPVLDIGVPSIRVTAADALSRMGDAEAALVLIDWLGGTDDVANRVAVNALRRLGDKALPSVLKALQSDRATCRAAAVNLLARIDSPQIVAPLVARLGDGAVSAQARKVLGQRLAMKETLDELLKLLGHDDDAMRLRAVELIEASGQVYPIAAVAEMVSDKDPRVRVAAITLLGKSGDKAAFRPLADAMRDKEANVKAAAGEALAAMGDKRANDFFLDILKKGDDADPHYLTAIRALGLTKDERASDLLLPLLELPESSKEGDRRRRIHTTAVEAIGRIGDKRAVEPLSKMIERDLRSGVPFGTVAKALGDIGDPRAFDSVMTFLATTSHRFHSQIRQPAIEALPKIDPQRAAEGYIIQLARVDPVDRQQIETLCLAMARLGDPRAIKPLAEKISAEALETRIAAARALKAIGEKHIPAMIGAMKEVKAGGRSAIAAALAAIGEPAVQPVLDALNHEAPEIRQGAAWALGEMGDKAHIAMLSATLSDKHPEVRSAAAWALGRLKHEPAMDRLIEMLHEKEPRPRVSAANALGRIGGEQAIAALIAAAGDESAEVRIEVITALAPLRNKKARDVVAAALEDKDESVRNVAGELMRLISRDKPAKPPTEKSKPEPKQP
jgi:HEAT repeat protein